MVNELLAELADTPPCRYPIHSSNISHSLHSAPATMLYSYLPCPNCKKQGDLAWHQGPHEDTVCHCHGRRESGTGFCRAELKVEIELSECEIQGVSAR